MFSMVLVGSGSSHFLIWIRIQGNDTDSTDPDPQHCPQQRRNTARAQQKKDPNEQGLYSLHHLDHHPNPPGLSKISVFRIRILLNPDPAKTLNPDPEECIRIRILAIFSTLFKNKT